MSHVSHHWYQRVFIGLALVFAFQLAAEAQILDTFEFDAEAAKRTDALNDHSRTAHAITTGANKGLDSLDSLASTIERYAPGHENTPKWRRHYESKRSQFYATRANDEQAMIVFRDVTYKTKRFLNLNERHKNTPAYKDLEEALQTAEQWIDYHDNRWENRESRPRALRDTQSGEPPGDPDGVPVLGAQRLTSDGLRDVGSSPTVSYRFTNNSRDSRIWFHAKLVEVDASGNIANRTDIVISPSDWVEDQGLDPGESIVLSWSVTLLRQRTFVVGCAGEITDYLPIR